MKHRRLFVPLLFGLTLSLAACGNSIASNQGETSTTEQANTAQMENPMTDLSSLEELSDQADCAMIRPDGVELSDESYHMIDGDTPIAEYSFTVNGSECFLRFSKAGAETDISGIYGDNGSLFEGQGEDPVYVENDDVKAERWFTVDGQYVFAVMDAGSWEWDAFSAIESQFTQMEPKNWDSQVPYEDYQKLVGEYSNEAGDAFGALSIRKDHMVVTVLMSEEDGNRLYWEMDAVLDGDQLVYEKENISQIVYDAESESTTTEAYKEEGAGSVTIGDDCLTFENASSTELKDLVLNRN